MWQKKIGKWDWILTVATLLAMLLTATAQADEAADSFLTGLDAMAAGKFDQSAQLLKRAAELKPDVAVRQLDHGVALLVLGKNDEAKDALSRAVTLDPQNSDARVWLVARAMMFDPTLPPLEYPNHQEVPFLQQLYDRSKPPLILPSEGVPYLQKLLTAILANKSSDPAARTQAKSAVENVAREFAREQRNGLEAVKVLYGEGEFKQALTILDTLLAKKPTDGVFLGYAGHCKLGLKDYAAARESYTKAMLDLPMDPGCMIGRAQCEVAMGSLDPAQADISLAERVGSKPAASLLAETKQLLAKAKSGPPKPAAEPSRQEQYTRELSRLKLDIRDHPENVENHLALVRFYLRPTAMCAVTLNGKVTRAKVPCGKMDVTDAETALAPAVKLAPDNPQVVVEQARVAYAGEHVDQMMSLVNRLMDMNAMDLEVAVAYMQNDNNAAKRDAAEANQIRFPPNMGQYVTKNPSPGVYIRQYVGPTAEQVAHADELDRQAKALHEQATRPLELLQKLTADKSDPQSQVTHHLVDAYDDLWIGNLNSAIESAEQAVAIDPVNEHAIRLLVEACNKAGSPKAKQYRAVFDELEKY